MTPKDSREQVELATKTMRTLASVELPLLLKSKPSRLVPITAMSSYPESPGDRDYYGIQMTNWLYEFFKARLSVADRKRFDSRQMTPAMLKQFDGLLIEKAAVYGWRIRLSRFVEARYSQWLEKESGGVELARRFDEAIRR